VAGPQRVATSGVGFARVAKAARDVLRRVGDDDRARAHPDRRPAAGSRLGRAGRVADAEPSWERTLGRLADGYRKALGEPATAAPERRVA
jgi:hypothetical protein